MKRMLCIWLPNWPIQRLANARPELQTRLLILYTPDNRGVERVAFCSPAVRDAGVHPGMPLAEAMGSVAASGGYRYQRRCPQQPLFLLHQPEEDREALEQLAGWCHQFSPLVGMEQAAQPDALYLEIAGSAPRLGGEQALGRSVLQAFQHRGYVVQVAIANTLGAAWALARQRAQWQEAGWELPLPADTPAAGGVTSSLVREASDNEVSTTATLLRASLSCLPAKVSFADSPLARCELEWLRIDPSTLQQLKQLGIHVLQQLFTLPRESLRARFGEQLLLRMDQLEGRVEEAIVAYRPPPAFEAEAVLEHPLQRRDAVEQMIMHLLEQVAWQLAAAGQGAIQLACTFACPPAASHSFQVGLYHPTADVKHLGDLVRMRLEQQILPGAVQRIQVQVKLTARLHDQQQGLFADCAAPESTELAQWINRVSCRLGRQGVVGVQLLAEPQIERSFRYVPLTGDRPLSPASRPQTIRHYQQQPGTRPLTLCQPPLPLASVTLDSSGCPTAFEYQGQAYQIVQQWGPERIETGWWRGPTIRRDYYLVEETRGARFWMFCNLRTRQWMLAGM